MFKVICLLLSVTYIVSAKDIKFVNCGGNNITRVTVTPCDEEPCAAKKGGSISITADFVSNQDAEKLSLWIGAKLGGVDLPLPGLDRDGCKDKGLTCPIKTGDKLTFKFDLKILPAYPPVAVTSVFEMTGDKDKKLFCFEAPVKITSA